MMNGTYPVEFAVEYPDRPLDRVTSFFRLFVAIPILIVLGSVSGGSWVAYNSDGGARTTAAAGGLLFIAPLWFLAIPHYIVLLFLDIGVLVSVVVVWFAILFTGRYPRGLFDFVEGAYRWHNRVIGYALILVTDQYPPFSLRP
jgi:hypothetical protein